jgi:hypothetical protein
MKSKEINMKSIDDELNRCFLEVYDSFRLNTGRLCLGSMYNLENSNQIILSELLEKYNFQTKFERIRYKPDERAPALFFAEPYNSVLRDLKKNNERSFSKFIEKLEDKIVEIGNTLPQKFELYYPIPIRWSEPPEEHILDDVNISFHNPDDICDILSNNHLNEQILRFMKENDCRFSPDRYRYLKVSIFARNVYYAQFHATRYVKLVAGLASFLSLMRRSQITVNRIPYPYLDLDVSLIFSFKSGKYQSLDFVSTNLGKDQLELDHDQIVIVNQFLNDFNDCSPKIKNALISGFSALFSGLTENRSGYAFFNFWSAVEIFCLKDVSITETEIKKRLTLPPLNRNEIDRYKIERLYNIRNQIVHNAEYETVSEYDRNLMKYYADNFIEFFINRLMKVRADELRQIWQYLSDDEANLRKQKELIERVIDFQSDDMKYSHS